MSSSTLVFLMQLLASLASARYLANHYTGGSVTFNTKRTNDGTFRVDIRFRWVNRGPMCGSPSYSCSLGNCGGSVVWSHSPIMDHAIRGTIDHATGQSATGLNVWCSSKRVVTRVVQTNSPFELSSRGCCWIDTVNNVGDYRLLAHMDLGTRSDTGEPNRSPDIAILPFLRVRQNCPRLYNLMAFDPDGDQVLCRYGTARGTECNRCSQPSGFHINQGSCTLHYNHTVTPGVYGFEMVVEDFPTHNISLAYTNGSPSVRSPLSTSTTTTRPTASSPPLSKLPLQFSLLVDSAAPSCVDGVYFPKFLHPTPRNGERLHAEVNQEMEIRVKAQATNSIVYDVLSDHLMIPTRRITHDEYVLRWTPVQEDVGDHFPICFVAQSVIGNIPSSASHHHNQPPPTVSAQSDIYQSEMRCVVVEVVPKNIVAHVICEENTMTVEVTKVSFRGLDEDHLRLSDPSNTVCSLQTHSNSTHIIAVFPLNACGTQIEEDDDSLHFRNEITSIDNNINEIITRGHHVEVKFCCQYSKRGNVSLGFFVHRSNVTFKEKGFGTFTYQFEFFRNNHFVPRTRIDPSVYPLEFDVGEKIYMEIVATSTLNETELFVESCSAAPYDTPNYSPVYPIIENGCIIDQTVEVYPSSPKYFRFGMEAFKFIGLYDQVYISCTVMVCEAGEPNSRCSQGCTSSPSSNGRQHHRGKRAAAIQTTSHFISQGPLRLRKTSATTVTNLNMNLVFMAGCLLAVVIYKTKMSSVKYQPMPSVENK